MIECYCIKCHQRMDPVAFRGDVAIAVLCGAHGIWQPGWGGDGYWRYGSYHEVAHPEYRLAWKHA